eukprot:CAMPEP_0198199820 /NCGR_PEP_ID=MMETSP1445-20131203/2968_1 /TAXON_ID=36898 /ORGANISM="Pyramimonas sp., Strain CCMP2087" /LENGTH=333 /DNA_ID=CAMNT_0043869721 /DNA_START=172 /DNA_END=1173 /DNA_ORIENTATION=+
MALSTGAGGSMISASISAPMGVSAPTGAPIRASLGSPQKKAEILLNSDDLTWGQSKKKAAAGMSLVSIIPVISIIFNKLKQLRRKHIERQEKEKRVKRSMHNKLKRLERELDIASGIAVKADAQRHEIEIMQQEMQERKEYAAKLEEQLRTDVVQQEIFRADLEDSVIEAVELTKQAETEKLEMLARLQQSEIAHAAEVDSLTAQILQLKIDAACKPSESSDFEDARDAVSETSSATHEFFEAAVMLKPQGETDAEDQETVAEEIAQPAVEIAQPAVEITKPADEPKRTHSEEMELARSLIDEYLKNGGDLSDLADLEMEDWPSDVVNGGPRK